jgi:hypothetical protein
MRNLIAIFLIGFYYSLFYIFFISPPKDTNEPILKDRFGTTIWHTGDKGGEEHIYCYYPGANSNTEGYILKRVGTISDCHGWYGTAILYEGKWATEKEKYI